MRVVLHPAHNDPQRDHDHQIALIEDPVENLS